MKIRQKQSHKIHEFWNCSRCLLRYIQWIPLLVLTLISNALYYCLSMQNVDVILTGGEAIRYYCSCYPHSNLVRIIVFYTVTFLPSFFGLRFLDSKICAEYYVVRLSSAKIFVLSKIFCITVLAVFSVAIRLLLFFVGTGIFDNVSFNMIAKTTQIFLLLTIAFVTFNLLIFLLYSITNHATITFVSFTVLLFYSLYFDKSIFMFWLYGLNAYYWTSGTVYADSLLLLLLLVALLLKPYNAIMREDEKNE